MSDKPAQSESEDGDVPHAPAGTWASESTDVPLDAPDESAQRLRDGRSSGSLPVREMLRRGEGERSHDSLPRSATASASPREASRIPARPPFLASELLRQRDERREPIAVSEGRIAGALGGALVVALVATHFVLGTTPSVGLLAAAVAAAGVMLVALLPLPEAKRSIALVGLGGSALAAGLLARGEAMGVLAALAALFTSAGLVLRSRRTAAWPARTLVGIGGLVALAWLVSTGVDGATFASFEPSALVGPTIALSLVVFSALTLLAFVDDHGSSGGGWIAVFGLGWALAEACAAALPGGLWPIGSAHTAIAPALVLPVTAIAIAQVLGGHPPSARTKTAKLTQKTAA